MRTTQANATARLLQTYPELAQLVGPTPASDDVEFQRRWAVVMEAKRQDIYGPRVEVTRA